MKSFSFKTLSWILMLAMLLALTAVAEDGDIAAEGINALSDGPSPESEDILIAGEEIGIEAEPLFEQSSDIDLRLEEILPEGDITVSEEAAEGDGDSNASIPKKRTLGIKETYALNVKNATFTSSKPTVASVNKAGVITAKKKGSAVITVKSGKKKIGSCKVTVVPAPKEVKLAIKSATLGIKETLTLVPEITEGSHASFTYTSKHPKIAAVNAKGVVTAKKAGSTTVTVKTHNGRKATLKVKVKKAPTQVTLKPDSLTMEVGQTASLTVSLPKGTASNKRTWTSDNKDVATVDGNGTVTAVGAGTAKITVKMFNKAKAVCPVTVTGAAPTEKPTTEPTQNPTPEPTQTPTPEPTQTPTPEPTQSPTPRPMEAPDFDLDSPRGHYKLSNYSNNGLILFFGRTTCGNCQNLLYCLCDRLDTLYAAGVDVVVSLDGLEKPADVAAIEADYPGFHYVYFNNYLLWDYLRAVNFNERSVTFPCVFVINSDKTITHYSTGYVSNVDNLVSQALKVATHKALPEPSR